MQEWGRSPFLHVDHLPAAPLEVVLLENASYGAGTDRGPRDPHRHDYHELIWTRCGTGRHLIDGAVTEVQAGTLTLIGRGQVHVFERAAGLHGAVVRFGDDVLLGDPAWLLGARGARSVPVPPGDRARLEALIDALAAEARRPADARTAHLERHFLTALLLWVERWYDATQVQHADADLRLYRRFTRLLDRDFARHHDPAHYADALRVPPAALSKALTQVTGQGTKALITDRRLLEAARLLRFSDLTVGEVGFRAGYTDQLYFSRAFKRRYGVSPLAYRGRP